MTPPKGFNSGSTDSLETSHRGNIIEQLEAKYFYRPAEDDGLATVEVQRRVDQCRIQARGGIDALLASTTFGKFLSRHLFDDPLQQERERRADQIEHYAQMLEGSGILPTNELAEQYARSYYEVLPFVPPTIILQTQLQGLLENSLKPFFQTNNLADLMQGYQHIKKELAESFNFSESGISVESTNQLLFRELVWKIKIQIAHLLSKQENTQVLEILAAVNTLSNNERMDFWSYLPLEINHLSKELSEKPQHRKILTDFSFRQMCAGGLASFHEFSTFLQKIGVKRLEGEELTELLDYQYLERTLDLAWKRDKKNYFQVIEFLMATEILPTTYLSNDKLLHRFIEYYLVSFYNGDDNNLQKEVLPYLIRLGIFPQKPTDPRENDDLINQYDQLCIRLKLDKDTIILQHYSRSKKPDKYLRGVDDD